MIKLSKFNKLSITRAIYDLERAINYIQDPNVAIAIRERKASTTKHYTRQDGATLYEVAKHSSDIVGFDAALRSLKQMIV